MPVIATNATEPALLAVYKRAAPLFVSARGCVLTDAEGREYLDFTAGIAVNALGYGDPGLLAAARAALDTGLIHVSNLFRTEPGEQLAHELVSRSFADRVFFCNSGAEANEAAIKFARRWAREAGTPEKHEIVALGGSFHGRLMGSLALTDRPSYQTPFLPLMPGARIVAADLAAVEAVASASRTAAIIVEPVQGEGGVVPLPAALLVGLRQIADRVGALLVFDEVQCGLGRTGALFAYELSGVVPDVMTLAKPLAGGLPMGAVLLTDRVASTLRPGDHATTFGGGPFVASVALHVLRRVSDPAFLARIRAQGEFIHRTVSGWIGEGPVRAVRGVGLMWGIELDRAAGPYVGAALEAGLLILTAGEKVIRLVPPLVIERTELVRGLAILRELLG
jgi:predicted acetylornithine/succinylornithine family transaminase